MSDVVKIEAQDVINGLLGEVSRLSTEIAMLRVRLEIAERAGKGEVTEDASDTV